MGIIAKQGLSNSFYIFLGFVLGGINTVFIFPYVFRNNLEDLGLIQLLVTISFVFGQLLTFGSVGITIRYYPKMQSENRLGQLMFYIWVLPSAALLLFGLVLLIFNEGFLNLFINEKISISSANALWILFIMTLGITYSRILSGYSAALKKTVFPSFLNEILIRIIILIFTAFYFFEITDLTSFGYGNSLAYFIPVLFLLLYLKRTAVFNLSMPKGKELTELLEYGFFTWMDLIATWLVNRIDQIMIAAMIFLSELPVYNFAFYMSLVVALPSRSLTLIAAPIIAESFHKKDMANIQSIYAKSSIVQLMLGGIIFLLVWINIDSILTFEPSSFSDAKMVFLYLGISKVIDIFFSVNGTILVSSVYYRYNLYFNVILLILAIVLNLIFIPTLGIEGAAIATAISLVLFNLMKAVFLFTKLKLQPFHKNTIPGLLLLGLSGSIAYLIPNIEMVILDMLVRSVVLCLIFFPTMIYFKISEDINEMFYKLLRRFFR